MKRLLIMIVTAPAGCWSGYQQPSYEPAPISDPHDSAPSPGGPTQEPSKTHHSAWDVKPGISIQAVAISPRGFVATIDGSELRVHAAANGAVLEQTRTCFAADDGLKIVSESLGIVVCKRHEVRKIEFPGLAQRKFAELETEADFVAWTEGFVVAADREGKVQVLDLEAGATIASFDVDEKVSSLAISPDGKLVAVGTRGSRVRVYDRTTDAPTVLKGGNSRATGLSFSPDGTRLLAQLSYDEASLFSIPDGERLTRFPVEDTAHSIRWMNESTLAVTNGDGVYLHELGSHLWSRLSDEREAIGWREMEVAPRHDMICAAGLMGRFSCFAPGELPDTGYKPVEIAVVQEARPTSAPTADPETPEPEMKLAASGTIKSRKGAILVVATSDSAPAKGTKGELSRRFERQLGGMFMQGWMSIATVKVLGSGKGSVRLRILEETADIKINGKKQNQFRRDFEVRLEIPAEPGP